MVTTVKILIITFYYYPDLCAGSFRCTQLVEQLQKQCEPNTQIEIITTFPNRYVSYSPDTMEFEQDKNITIRRIKLPKHQSGIIDQSKAFIYFAKEVIKFARSSQYDLVFATSSRLMTAVLGALIAKKQKAKLFLDIRDLFVDTIGSVFSKKISFFAKPFFSILEKWSFKKANHINLVSYGFNDYFKTRYPDIKLSYFSNGISLEFVNGILSSNKCLDTKKELTVLYAGNIGEGQGLHLIIPELAGNAGVKYHFKIIGDGGRIGQLKAATEHLSNVTILPPVKRADLIKAYQSADILFLHLNSQEAFLKVLPSKLFEYAAMGKPILAGVSGYAAHFIHTELDNAAVFEPCNTMQAMKALSSIIVEDLPRTEFVNKYLSVNIMSSMAAEILST